MEDSSGTNERKRFVIVCTAAFVILWAGALRGSEVFILEASEFVKRRNVGRNNKKQGHWVIPEMGMEKRHGISMSFFGHSMQKNTKTRLGEKGPTD